MTDPNLHAVDTIRCGLCKLDLQTVIQLILHKTEHAGHTVGIACELCGTGFTRRKALLDHYRHRHLVVANFGDGQKKDHKENLHVSLHRKQSDDQQDRIQTRSVGRKRKQDADMCSEGKGDGPVTNKEKKEIILEQNSGQNEVIPASSNNESKTDASLRKKTVKEVADTEVPKVDCAGGVSMDTGVDEEGVRSVSGGVNLGATGVSSGNATGIHSKNNIVVIEETTGDRSGGATGVKSGGATGDRSEGAVGFSMRNTTGDRSEGATCVTIGGATGVSSGGTTGISSGSITGISSGGITGVSSGIAKGVISGGVTGVISRGATDVSSGGSTGAFSRGVTDVSSGGASCFSSGGTFDVHVTTAGYRDGDTICIKLSDGAIKSTGGNKNFIIKEHLSNTNSMSTDGQTDALCEQESIVISDSKGNDDQGDSQSNNTCDRAVKKSESVEVGSSDNESVLETCVHNSLPESHMQASCNFYDPFIDIVTKKFKGASFEYAKDVYFCKECGFSCHCSLEIKKHIHGRHPNVIDEQSAQGDTVSSDMVVTNEENSPRIRRKVEKQDIIGHYVCSKCKKVFTRLRYLRKHLQTHKTEENYLCDECGKHFKTKSYLNTHRKIHEKKAFKCQECDFTSENAFEIHMHRQIHNNGCVICEVCGNAYSDKSTLVKHKRVHDMSRPFACSYPGCTWRFKSESSCLAHLKGHSTVEGKFKCSKCGYAFRHKHHMKRHESAIHGLHHGKVATNRVINNEVISSSNSISKNQDVDVNNTVRLLLNTADGDNDISNALQPGNIVITTDTDGNPVNYHVTDIEIGSGCETVLEQDKNVTVALCVQTPQEDPQSHYVPLNISLTEELLTDIGNTESIHTEITETRTQVPNVSQ